MPANQPRPSFWKRFFGLSDIGRKDGPYGAGLTFITPQWGGSTLGETAKGYDQAIRYGLKRNELIYACTMAKANAAASVSLKAYEPNDHEELPKHPVRTILQHPNPKMTESDLWSLNVINNILSGHSFWQKIRSKAKITVQLYPLRPDWMTPVRGDAKQPGQVTQWRYGAPGSNYVMLSDADVIDFNLLDPKDPIYGGLAPIEVLSRTGDVDNALTDFLKGFFEHGAMPIGVLTSSQQLRPDDVDFIRENWRQRYSGWRNWMDPAILSMETKFQQIGLSFKDMAFADLDDRAEARICMVLGVPAIVAEAHVGLKRSTYANYQEARLSFWEDHLFPMFQHYKDVIETQLAPDFGDDFELDWDFSDIPALQDDQHALRQHALAMFSAGGLMLDQLLESAGLDPLPNGKGQVFYVPNTVSVTRLEDLGAPPKPVAPPVPTVTVKPADENPALREGEPGDKPEELPARTEKPAAQEPGKSLPTPAALLLLKRDAPDEPARLRHEQDVEHAMTTYFGGLVRRVQSEVGHGGAGGD